MIDDAVLQQLFAELLARSNSDKRHRQPIILETLKKLSSEDAATLKALHGLIEGGHENWARIEDVGEHANESAPRLVAMGLIQNDVKPEESYGEEGEILSEADELQGPVVTDPKGKVVIVTGFGRQFLASLGLPISKPDPHWASTEYYEGL